MWQKRVRFTALVLQQHPGHKRLMFSAVLVALLIAGLNGYLLVSVLRDPGSLSVHA
jgi:hypothetical protein